MASLYFARANISLLYHGAIQTSVAIASYRYGLAGSVHCGWKKSHLFVKQCNLFLCPEMKNKAEKTTFQGLACFSVSPRDIFLLVKKVLIFF